MIIGFYEDVYKGIGVDSFRIKGKVYSDYGIIEEEVEFNFKNKNVIKKSWYDDGYKIIKVERISENEYKIRFFEEDIEGNEEEIEYDGELEVELNCRCGRDMEHEHTKYGLVSDCLRDKIYNCVGRDDDEGCGYEVIISFDDC